MRWRIAVEQSGSHFGLNLEGTLAQNVIDLRHLGIEGAIAVYLWTLGKTRSTEALAGCRRALDALQDLETQLFERLAASVAAAR